MRNESTVAAPDCRAFLERVLASERGAKVLRPTNGAAVNFRQRCYNFVLRDRKANAKIYPEGHPLHAASTYDSITLQISREDDGAFAVVGYATPEAAAQHMNIIDL